LVFAFRIMNAHDLLIQFTYGEIEYTPFRDALLKCGPKPGGIFVDLGCVYVLSKHSRVCNTVRTAVVQRSLYKSLRCAFLSPSAAG
jgi:hypothetical protein